MSRMLLVWGILMAACVGGRAASLSFTKVSPTSSIASDDSTATTPSPIQTKTNQTSNDTQTSQCIAAHNASSPGPHCHPYYNHSTGICNSSISVDELIFVDKDQQNEYERLLRTVRVKREFIVSLKMPNPALLLRSQCFQVIQDMYCHYYFPKCDTTASTPHPQPICREACELLNYDCKYEWIRLMRFYPGVTWSAQEEIGEKRGDHESLDRYERKNILMKCDGLPTIKGPTFPECYIPYKYLRGKTAHDVGNASSENCFYGNGYTYRGKVSVTKSGYKCQSWSEQCPHRHYRTPEKYQELIEAGNACRNPGHQAPHGPWCYTTNPDVRWEYCEIAHCEHNQSQSSDNDSSPTQKPIRISTGQESTSKKVPTQKGVVRGQTPTKSSQTAGQTRSKNGAKSQRKSGKVKQWSLSGQNGVVQGQTPTRVSFTKPNY